MIRRAILVGAPFSALLLALPAHALTVDSAGTAQTGTSASVRTHGALEVHRDADADAARVRAVVDDAATRGKRAAHSSVHAAVGVGQSAHSSVTRARRAVTANGATSTTPAGVQIDAGVTAATPSTSASAATADSAPRPVTTTPRPNVSVSAGGAASLQR